MKKYNYKAKIFVNTEKIYEIYAISEKDAEEMAYKMAKDTELKIEIEHVKENKQKEV